MRGIAVSQSRLPLPSYGQLADTLFPPPPPSPPCQVSRKEMQATLALRFGGEGILKVKGIPFKASAADVRKFFSGYKIKNEGVSFIMHSDGRPTGMAFIEFESPQEAVKAMDKDRTKFGPEYGDRFCMLQLVGRHEMDKVTLQRESEANHKLMNGIHSMQLQALATQAALNPALQLQLLAANPWLTSLGHPGMVPNAQMAAQLGQMNPNNANGGGLDTNALASQFGSQLGSNGPLNNMNAAAGINALNFLQQQQAAAGIPPSQGPGEVPPGWMTGLDPSNNVLFYPGQANGEGHRWADPRCAAGLAAAAVMLG
jgi:hypothetical protein